MRHRDMYQTDALRDIGTMYLLEAARAVGARRFLVESMYVGYGFGDWGEKVLTEDQPFGPPGRSRELERHLAAFRSMERQIFEETRAGRIEGVSLRYGAFYGPGATDQLAQMLLRRRLPLPGGGQAVMSWIYIEDAAAAMIAALERARPGQAYNIVDDEPVQWRDFLTLFAREIGAPPPRSVPCWTLRLAAPYAYTILCATSMRASNARARAELGWAPDVPTYRQGIQRVAQMLRAAA
jgi:nucleoside-diphosphate-sugar epimerase